MAFTDKQIQDLANLARIAIDSENSALIKNKLSNILNLFGQLDNINTENVAPMAHPVATEQTIRADQITEDVTKNQQLQKLQNLSSATEENLYLVPLVID